MRNPTAIRPQPDIETIRISDREWRIRDCSRSEQDATCACGIVSVDGDIYEAMRTSDPHTRRYFDFLAAAVMFLVPDASL